MSVYAVLATWPDRQTAERSLQQSAIFARYRQQSTENWTIFMKAEAARGRWSGQTPFSTTNQSQNGPLAVMTRATLRPRNLARFWRRVPNISQVIGQDPNVVFKIGIGESALAATGDLFHLAKLGTYEQFCTQGASCARHSSGADGGLVQRRTLRPIYPDCGHRHLGGRLPSKKTGYLMKQPFPFSAIVGQDDMKLAMVLTAIDPSIAGVLVFGERGTGKSTAVRALAGLLPPITAVTACPVNSADVKDCPAWCDISDASVQSIATPVVDLPLGASEDRVTGALDIEKALTKGEKAFQPGLFAQANRGGISI